MPIDWKPGRGKLGPLAPILGDWVAGSTPNCERSYAKTLGDKYIELRARWTLGPDKFYDETALIGFDEAGVLTFWSFTSDGKRSTGIWTDVSDLHPQAFGFLAKMPAGTARMAYYPHPEEGFIWVVESQTKKGWNRMVEHHYRLA